MKSPCPLPLAASLLLLAGPFAAGAQETAPLDSTAHIQRAIAAMRAGQWKPARTAWEAVLKLEPDNAAALSNLGKVQYQLADYAAARESLEKATLLKPSLVDSWLTLGQTYLELKAPMMAVSATTRGVAENPADARSHNTLAIVLKRIGWTNGAEAELQKALDLDPASAEAHFNLAVLYLERKPPALEMAGRHYRRARSLGAEPDLLLEKQMRGESDFEETDAATPSAGEKAPDAVAPPGPGAKPPRATPVPDAAPPARKSPPKKPNPPSRKSAPS